MIRSLTLAAACLLPSLATAAPTTYVVKGPLGNVRKVWVADGPGGTLVYRWRFGWHRDMVRQYP